MDSDCISATELSKATGVSTTTFSQWKKGLQKPSTEAIVKIADYFGISTDYLLGRTDSKEPVSVPGKKKEPLELQAENGGMEMNKRLVKEEVFQKGVWALFGIKRKIEDDGTLLDLPEAPKKVIKELAAKCKMREARLVQILNRSMEPNIISESEGSFFGLGVAYDAWPNYFEWHKLMEQSGCGHDDAKCLLRELRNEIGIIFNKLSVPGMLELLAAFISLDDKGRTKVKNVAYEEESRMQMAAAIGAGPKGGIDKLAAAYEDIGTLEKNSVPHDPVVD